MVANETSDWEHPRWTLARIRTLILWQFDLDVSPAG